MRLVLRYGLGLIALTSASLSTGQTTPPDPDKVYITGFVYNGTGCPAGTASAQVAPDGESFTAKFTKMTAEAGPGIPYSANRKNCAMSVRMHIPSGFSVAIQSVEYAGYARLDSKVTGTQVATYWPQGSTLQNQSSMSLTGPLVQNFDQMDTIPIENLIFSPCGEFQNQNINLEVRANNMANRSGRGLMSVATLTNRVETTFHLVFQPCVR